MEKIGFCQNFPQEKILSTGFPQQAVENKMFIYNNLSRFSTFPQALLLLLDKYICFKVLEIVKGVEN